MVESTGKFAAKSANQLAFALSQPVPDMTILTFSCIDDHTGSKAATKGVRSSTTATAISDSFSPV